ncbi:Guanylate cyclase [Seminavis robusta]|uniref:Guanylate cyclase n=1 Tax=Seminavis robusta TaxID=568900 RepID=A0A9N8DX03_9STRA|nr:Guanylate cyclase [Seminavis robusta]|eukprot:Sro439_g143320.1 Guanylate cyclase (232) ;mRNA; f:63246-64044
MALPETHPADASLFSSNDPPLNLPPSDNNIDDSDSFDDEDPENETHYTVDNEGKTGLEEQQQQKKEIAKDETRMVGRMRLILLLVLVACVIVVSLAVNFYVKNEENSDFETEFFSDANKVIEGISGSLDITLGAVDAYASKMVGLTKVDNGGDVSETTIVDNVNANTTSTSSAIPTSFPSRFPFVTVPGFGVQAAKMIKLSRAAQFIVALIVTAQDREAWDAYSVQNTQWM